MDVLTNYEKMFDMRLFDEFETNLRMLERIVTAPKKALDEYEMND